MATPSTFGTRTGNHIIIEMDDQQVGLIQNMRANDDYGLEPVMGIGDINAQEIVPTAARHQIQAGFVALRKTLLGSKSFMPRNGEEALKGLTFDIIVYDKNDGGNPADNSGFIRKYTGVSCGGGDFSVEANRPVIRNATFLAISCEGDL